MTHRLGPDRSSLAATDQGRTGVVIDPRTDLFFATGDLLLDLGCGDGRWLDEVAPRYRNAVGIDIAVERFSRRSSPPHSWRFVQADLNETIPVATATVDAVHANQVMEHIANPLRFAAEIYRVLRPGGLVVATTPNVRYVRHTFELLFAGTGPMTSGRRSRTADNWDDGHIHFFTAADLRWIMTETGFREVRTRALMQRTGRLAWLRRVLDAHSGSALVQNFLSGNTLLVAKR